jgi:hypothetical protein
VISIRGLVAVVGVVAVGASAGLLVTPRADAAGPVTETFSYTGGSQTFVVPEGVTELTIEVFGAQGGAAAGQSSDTTATAEGGLGGRAQVTFAVTPGAVLQVNVGGRGGDGTDAPSSGSPGFNGGGAGGSAAESGTTAGGGGGFNGCFSKASGGGGGGRYGGGTAPTADGDLGGGAGGGSSNPTTDTTSGVRAGNGLVRITYAPTDRVVVRFTG